MLLATRGWIALIGLLSLFSVYQHWFDLGAVKHMRGLSGAGAAGAANLRADVGGIFLAIALFAFVAAWKRSSTWLLATLLLPAMALSGRLVSLMMDGMEQGVFQPILIETIVIATLGAIYVYWKKLPEGL